MLCITKFIERMLCFLYNDTTSLGMGRAKLRLMSVNCVCLILTSVYLSSNSVDTLLFLEGVSGAKRH